MCNLIYISLIHTHTHTNMWSSLHEYPYIIWRLCGQPSKTEKAYNGLTHTYATALIHYSTIYLTAVGSGQCIVVWNNKPLWVRRFVLGLMWYHFIALIMQNGKNEWFWKLWLFIHERHRFRSVCVNLRENASKATPVTVRHGTKNSSATPLRSRFNKQWTSHIDSMTSPLFFPDRGTMHGGCWDHIVRGGGCTIRQMF